MTDTPERIALRWEPGAAVTSGPLMTHPDYTRWVREDVAEAAVAAAVQAERARCARVAENFGPSRPHPPGAQPIRITGRWEGEQAASASIAAAIRAGGA